MDQLHHQQQQLQQQKKPSILRQIKNLSTIQLCIVLGGAFCMIASIMQVYVHSEIHHVSSANELDDDIHMIILHGDDDYTGRFFKPTQQVNEEQAGKASVILKPGTKQEARESPPSKKTIDNTINITSPAQLTEKEEESAKSARQEAARNSRKTKDQSEEKPKKMENNSTKIKKPNEFRGEIINCGCPTTCTAEVLFSGNDNFNCKTRITGLMAKYNFTQTQACEASSKISKDDPDEDGMKPCPMQCHPSQCHQMPTKYGIDCGCPHSCDERALHKRNPQFLCKDRILHLVNKKNLPELEACELASQTTYNHNDTENIDINKPCEYECHPKICKGMDSRPVLQDVTNVDLPKELPFQKYDDVVIVTKVLSSDSMNLLTQMLCLFNTAYNRFVHYDIIIFTTVPFVEEDIVKLQQMAHPAKLQVVTEGKSLEEHLSEMSVEERKSLDKRCRVKSNETITWGHHCEEKNSEHVSSLGYAWQAEFRTFHLWTHAAMKPYKYMMWLDADAMCTKAWDVDPMKVMIENDLILLFDHFPAGFIRGKVLKQKMLSAYNETICKVTLDKDSGVLKTKKCKNEEEIPSIHQVYGFHHITNLDVYRKERHQRFLKEMISNDYKFSRLWDDQLAVTLPAVMEDPSRCWDYQTHGLNVTIHHNGRIDGKRHPKYLSYLNYWANEGKYNWPAARAMCDGLVTEIC